MTAINLDSADEFLTKALALIAGGAKEQAVRDNLTSYLRSIFPDTSWWVEEHIQVCEKKLHYSKAAKTRRGFVDNLVGCTVIEYEANLNNKTLWNDGYKQVQIYCAGLLSEGADQDKVVGVLSDTVNWHAYRVASFEPAAPGAKVDPGTVVLEEIEPPLKITSAGKISSRQLTNFFAKYIGRQGARRLSAESIAQDLGFDSAFYSRHFSAIHKVVGNAIEDRPEYAMVLKQLWDNFVGFVQSADHPVKFDIGGYSAELYIVTLVKLVVANTIERRAIANDDDILREILSGRYFAGKGIRNLVEYDYFGWLNEEPWVTELVPVAREIQADLLAYDFQSVPAEDLFGRMFSQLARRSERILLGQTWTPAWLAERMVKHVLEVIPEEQQPHLLDMCCGSGAMVVAAIKKAVETMPAGVHDDVKLNTLESVITGFDIDPLAVLLAKASWLLAARSILEPFDGGIHISIPVYNADSLIYLSGVARAMDQELAKGSVKLHFADKEVELPALLVAPELQRFFDVLLDNSYKFALDMAKDMDYSVTSENIDRLVNTASEESDYCLKTADRKAICQFTDEFVSAVRVLQYEQRNGIWAFVLKNNYRPFLVRGQFNGLVSNPPWLALSKLRDNPYAALLKQKASEYAIKPSGAVAHHIELATVFLLHAVERFLADSGKYACVLPESVINGKHQMAFRKGKYLTATKRPVPMSIDELWRVDDSTFETNVAVVLCGGRTCDAEVPDTLLPGKFVSEASEEGRVFLVNKGRGVHVWNERTPGKYKLAGHTDSRFRQGADVFPRRLWFHQVTRAARGTIRKLVVGRIPDKHALSYLVSDEKKDACKTFKVPSEAIKESLFQDVLISKHLAPFHLAEPAKALLPFVKNRSGRWSAMTPAQMALERELSRVLTACINVFGKVQGTKKSASAVFDYVNSVRGKLFEQQLAKAKFLVVYGASGGILCAALVEKSRHPVFSKLIIDQTLYCAPLDDEDEAVFLVGMLNSEAVDDAITPFQPQGKLKERHIHKLPFLVVPRFNPKDAKHRAVVANTKTLLAEIAAIRSSLGALLSPATNLGVRRRNIREKIKTLAAYKGYSSACEAVLT